MKEYDSLRCQSEMNDFIITPALIDISCPGSLQSGHFVPEIFYRSNLKGFEAERLFALASTVKTAKRIVCIDLVMRKQV